MIIPVSTPLMLSSIVWLVMGIKGRKERALLMLNLYGWVQSCCTSENGGAAQ